MSSKLPGSDDVPPTPDPVDTDLPALPARDPRLTARQASFVAHYLDTRNGAESARRAGFVCKDNHAAASTATRLLTNIVIKEAVRAGLDATWNEAHASRAERISILSRIMRGELMDGQAPPSFAERIQAGRVLAAMLDPQRVQVANTTEFIVRMPLQIKNVDEWAATARQVMEEHDRKTTYPGAQPEGTNP